MSDSEFELLDYLYFTLTFKELLEESALEEDVLIGQLKNLQANQWLKVLDSNESDSTASNWAESPYDYKYLASKEGLLAHNGM